MKQAFAILFILALALGQPLATSAATCAGFPAPCCNCGGKMKCCVAQSSNTSQENPAAPASTVTQKNLQAALWPVVHTPTPVASNGDRVAATDSSSASVRTVPLFARDCAYLL